MILNSPVWTMAKDNKNSVLGLPNATPEGKYQQDFQIL